MKFQASELLSTDDIAAVKFFSQEKKSVFITGMGLQCGQIVSYTCTPVLQFFLNGLRSSLGS